MIGIVAGLGGGNFASSMANINFFYPSDKKGAALGLNAAGGNLGVSLIQLLLPVIVTVYALILGDRWMYVVFWPLPSILASIQLFVFGTWLPHRPDHDAFPDRHNARSTRFGRPLSLLTCFHFGGYHHEHHLYPSVPWWQLPSTRGKDER